MFQYRISTLLLVMAVAAFGTWVLFVLPSRSGTLVLACSLAVIPGVIAAGIVYARGYRRAFCVGAAPLQLLLLAVIFSFASDWLAGPYQIGPSQSYRYQVTMISILCGAVVSGAGAARICYLAQAKSAATNPETEGLAR